MNQTIKRKPQSARKAAAAQGTARKVRSAKAKTGSAVDTAISWLPFNEEQLHRILLALILGGAAALAWTVASHAGVPEMAGYQLATAASDAGFAVPFSGEACSFQAGDARHMSFVDVRSSDCSGGRCAMQGRL